MRLVTHSDSEDARGGGSPSHPAGYISSERCPECGSRRVRVSVDPAARGATMISKRCCEPGCEIMFDVGLV